MGPGKKNQPAQLYPIRYRVGLVNKEYYGGGGNHTINDQVSEKKRKLTTQDDDVGGRW